MDATVTETRSARYHGRQIRAASIGIRECCRDLTCEDEAVQELRGEIKDFAQKIYDQIDALYELGVFSEGEK